MDRAQEFDFVWGLLDAGASFLDATVRVQLCVKIGAGDYRDSIVELLQRFSTVDAAIPPRLAPSLWAWVNGFMGSDSETFLHTLASRIRISNASSTESVPNAEGAAPLMAHRGDRAQLRLAVGR